MAESIRARFQVANKLPPMLDNVLINHDGGYSVFDYKLYSVEELSGIDDFVIGANPVRRLSWPP